MSYVVVQVWIFAGSVLLGASFALCYDVLIALRKEAGFGNMAIGVLDVIFSALLGMVSFMFILANVNGKLRFFIFVGELIGAVIYRLTISPVVLKLLRFVFKMIFALAFGPTLWVLGGIKKIFKNGKIKGKKVILAIKTKTQKENVDKEKNLAEL